MQCYSELTPPSGVTHAVALALTAPRSANLAVAKASLLQIFATTTMPAEEDVAGDAGDAEPESVAPAPDEGDAFLGDAALVRSDKGLLTKLVLVAEVALAGTITGLARVRVPGTRTGGDALLVSFKDARLSLMEWDPATHTLETLSIHYYEQDELLGAPWTPPLSECYSYLAADPAGRCAALQFGLRNLAVLPFRAADEDEDVDVEDEDVENADKKNVDVDMDDWDEEIDGPRPAKPDTTATDIRTTEDTPFLPSFVLRLSTLDPTLLHPVHLAFLHEYREPTFGVLSAAVHASTVLGRKDCLSYAVYTLDLPRRAATPILTVAHLPQDLFCVVPVPSPVGGALLVGPNALIHVDQSSRNGVAVNPFAKQTTNFSLADQSDLGLRLEGCHVDVLSADAGELLLVLRDGRAALVTLVRDGRAVSGVRVALVPSDKGGELLLSDVTATARVGRQALFVGSETADSVVLGWTRHSTTSRRKTRLVDEVLAHVDVDLDSEDDEDDEDDLDDDDDLYGGAPAMLAPKTTVAGGDLVFRVHDRLLGMAPVRGLTYGRAAPLPAALAGRPSEEKTRSALSLACTVGRGRGSALALVNRRVRVAPIGVFDFSEARALWTMSARRPVPRALAGDANAAVGDDYATQTQFDRLMIVAKDDGETQTSDVYALTGSGFEKLAGTEFEPAAGLTLQAGTMGRHARVVQVLTTEVRCYDGDLGLAQILPMVDEDTDAELGVTGASMADPYLLLLRDDHSALVAEMNADLELEELEHTSATLAQHAWTAGCLYRDTGAFSALSGASGEPSRDGTVLAFLCSDAGVLHVYALPAMTLVYATDGLGYVPPVLTSAYEPRHGSPREDVAELLVADLGDAVAKAPYMVLRHPHNRLTLYQPVQFEADLRFVKCPVSQPEAAELSESAESADPPMRACDNIGGYSTVFIPGAAPSFILKSAKSVPRVLGLQGAAVRSLSPFHTQGCARGLIYVDVHGTTRVGALPAHTNLAELGVAVRKVPLHMDTNAVAYHAPTDTFVASSCTEEDFALPTDEPSRAEWAGEDISFRPQVERGRLQLLSAASLAAIDTYEMEQYEVAMCVEALTLEVSEATNERKPLVAVGTALARGEDLPVRGRIYVFDVVPVVPEPGRPDKTHKLKLVAKEDIPRGAVTALSAVGTQGLLLVAQGQKCLVRGLKEDGTLLPVAFMDMGAYVTSARELPGTGLLVMADAFKGVWFAGYTEEPYKMVLFGKSHTRLAALNVDLLPDGRQLYLVAGDPAGNLHVLAFDPDHPKSLQGHLLLHRASFGVGAHLATHSLLLPSTSVGGGGGGGDGDGDGESAQHLVLASPTGVLAQLAPLDETAYRRLASLQTQLANVLAHPAGLSPKGYRAPVDAGAASASLTPGVDTAVARSIVDGALLQRWGELGTERQAELAGRVGFGRVQDVRAALGRVLGWSRMAYF